MKNKISIIGLIVIILMQILLINFQHHYYKRDLREQEEAYTTELNRLSKICKENKRSVQAPEHKSKELE